MTRRKITYITLGAAAALAVVGITLSVLKDRFASRARGEIETRGSELLDARVRLSDLELSLLPPSVTLIDLGVSKQGNRGSTADASVPEARLRAGLLTFLGLRKGPYELEIERPVVRFLLAEGRPVLDVPSEDARTGLPLDPLNEIPPGSTIKINDGRAEFGFLGGSSVDLSGLEVEARWEPGRGGLTGNGEFTGGTLRALAAEWSALRGEGAFSLGPAGLRLDGLSVRGKGIALVGDLLVAGDKRIKGTVQIGIETAMIAPLLPRAAEINGRVETNLTGEWDAGVLRAEGDFSAVALNAWGVRIDSLQCDLSIDEEIRARGIRAHLFGGQASGSLIVTPRVDRFRAEADLSLDGVSLEQLLEFAGWTGPSITGTLHYRGRHRIEGTGLEDVTGSGVIDAVGRYRTPGGVELPVEVTAKLTTNGEVINFRGGVIRAGSARGSFSGTVKRDEGIRIKLSGATGDISEILPLFRMVPQTRGDDERIAPPTPGGENEGAGKKALPVRLVAWTPVRDEESPLERVVKALGGEWEWSGEIRYGASGLVFDGRLSGTGLVFRGTELGSLEASVSYHDEVLVIHRGRLTREVGERMTLSGTIRFGEDGSIDLTGDAAGFPVGTLVSLAEVDLPIAGDIDGSFSVEGRLDSPGGRVSLTGREIVLAGVPVQDLSGDITLVGDLIEVHDLSIGVGDGRVEVSGSILYRTGGDEKRFDDGPGAQLEILGSGLELLPWVRSLAGLEVEGTASIQGVIGGSLNRPEGHLVVHGTGVRTGSAVIGEAIFEVGLSGDDMVIRAAAPDRGVRVEGTVGRGADLPVDLTARLDGSFVRGGDLFPDAPSDLLLRLGGRARITGPLGSPEALEGDLTLDLFSIEAPGFQVRSETALEARFSRGVLRLNPVLLSGTGTEIDLGGDIGIGPDGRVDLSARGSFDLRLLRPFYQKLQATGHGEIGLRVAGRRDTPTFAGSLAVTADAVRHPVLPFPLDQLEARMSFDESRVTIDSLHFLAGDGPVEGSGEIHLVGTGGRRIARVESADIHLTGSGVKSEFPAGFRSVADLDLRLLIEKDEPTLSGEIDLIKGTYTSDFRIESTLMRGDEPGMFELDAPDDLLEDLALDLRITAAQDVWLRNDLATLEGQGELEIRGTAARPSVSGRIAAVEGGVIRFRRQQYRLRSGSMNFADPDTIDPIFDLLAETLVSNYRIQLRVEGTVDDFRYELSSSPPLGQEDIVSVLLTGRTLSQLGSSGVSIAEEEVSAYLAGMLTDELAESLTGRVGLDLITINPMSVNAEGNPATRVTIGKQVTSDLFVTYAADLGAAQGSIYQFDYSVNRDIRFTTLRDKDGSVGGDIKYILRGNPPTVPALEVEEQTERPPVIEAVHLTGIEGFKESRLRRRLRLKPGQPLDRGEVNDGVDRIVRFYRDRGHQMVDVRVAEQRSSTPPRDDIPLPEKVSLAVRVEAGPHVVIGFEGIRRKEGIRQEIVGFWQEGIFLDAIVDSARDWLTNYFNGRGYLDAEVTSEVLRSDEDVFHVVYGIRKGVRMRAREVRVAGARQIPEEELLEVIRTSPDTLFSRGLVTTTQLSDDGRAIRDHYLSHGYAHVVVDETEVQPDESGRRATVTFRVKEGPRVTVESVRIKNGGEVLPEESAIAIALEGRPYTAEKAEEGLIRLRRAYDGIGFPDARVRRSLVIVGGEGDEETAHLVYDIERGSRQKVGDVQIAGNVLTRGKVIRNDVTINVRPEGPLSRKDLQESQSRLYRRGVFTSVSVENRAMQESGSSEGQSDAAYEQREVLVTVAEAAPIQQSFGIGYDNEKGLRGEYEVANHNLFGTGRYLGLQTRGSGVERRGSILYQDTGIAGGRYDLMGTAFWADEDRPAFTGQRVGTSLQLNRQVSRAARRLYLYTLQDVSLDDPSAVTTESAIRLASLGTKALHDTRDAPFNPMRGHLLSVSLDLFGEAIGSEAEFAKLYAQAYAFKEVLPRTVWAQAFRAGIAVPFGISSRMPELTGDSNSGIPRSERFIAGGDTTLRGFETARAGPLDPAGDPIGGELLVIINEELRFPIFQLLQGAIFYDGGNVFLTPDDFSMSGLRHVVGAGLRMVTPIGPLRVEYGAILDRQPDEPRGRLFFSIGQAF